MSAGWIRDAGDRTHDDSPKILTPSDEYNQSHNGKRSEWRIARQMQALKQQIGLGSILGLLAIIIAVGAPVVKQSELNGTYTTSIDRLASAQKEDKEAQAKALAEGLARIETQVNRVLDLAQSTQIEVRSVRASAEGGFVELRQDTKGLWKWATAIDGRVGVLEAEIKKKER